MSDGLDFDIEQISRPGYRLAQFKDAALPIYQLTVKVLTLERKPINPIEEGCLRAISAGLSLTKEIREFLGLEEVVLNSVLASLNSQELINYMGASDGEATASLTLKGTAAVDTAHMSVPEERIIKLMFDPYLKRVVFHQPGFLWRPKEVKTEGKVEVPLCGAKRPEVEDVPLEDIDAALERMRRPYEDSKELLAIRRIERREMLFLPCTMLYFRSETGSETQVAFYLDNKVSVEHENAFRDLGGVEEVGARHVLNDQLPEVLSQAALAPDQASELLHLPKLTGTSGAETNLVPSFNPTLKNIRCHEHPGLLEDALLNSKERLMIISPWIRHQVVTDRFVRNLEALLRAGVKVYIGYGLVDEDGRDKAGGKLPITPKAERDLKDLDKRFGNLTFAFIGNTHRKVLVSDTRYAITTSFNWLSFKGDPKEKPRDEAGIYIAKPDYIESTFNDCLDLIQKGYAH
ncbi:hypothetical protein A7X93_01365 [Stenotrophomonas maltophilia]|uniref:hypothetical protein n=1 Tax=Stenotrophomonas maltophilia TaxID=40324 RepID=UPI000DA739AB|nr:hypothetical protein [Stenotrophomonas maltophilia]MDZ5840520.1 hypothetical protein [Stenotrophomonas maltophilia]PZT31825.1 hypothetical protein A7X93_01365 [Stenotrophomonas maltophilia]HDS1556797.1 hypothetical protein [Stenotrophomonas maltophilia]HEL5052633.1 hypothetical protein [Stenotrophomonas maltophilia]